MIITQLLCCETNITSCSFPGRPRRRLPGRASRKSAGAHLRAQALDVVLDVKRQWRATLHRDPGIEFGRLGNAQQFDAGIAAMGDGELIDHGDAESGLDQRADRGAEPRPYRDVVAEFLARENL